MHHVFDGGWIWVLRFNNGITSAGAAATRPLATALGFGDGASAWHRLLAHLPSVRDQFGDAVSTREFIHARVLACRMSRVTGPAWAMLPSAAGFIDPLLSTGFALNFLGLGRMARLLEEDWLRPRFEDRLARYGEQTQSELDATELLIAALYAAMGDFATFRALALLYFAAVGFTEISRRLGLGRLAGDRFLLGDHPKFAPALRDCCQEALRVFALPNRNPAELEALRARVMAAIEPIDLTGLRRGDRRFWYPVDPDDLLDSAPKLGLSPDEAMRRMKGDG
jgi:FADH2 O2-dependent halogenase